MKNSNILIFILIILFLSLGLNFYLFSNNRKFESTDSTSQILLQESNEIDVLVKKSETENIYKIVNSEFQKVNDLVTFKNFQEKYHGIEQFIIFVRLKDKENVKKYLNFLLHLYNVSDDIEGQKKLDEFLEKVYSGDEIIPTDVDGDFDLPYFFNTLEISHSTKICDKLSLVDKYFVDTNSCLDKIFLYRATSKNKYCEKISDPYKIRLCNDFLKYANQ